MYLKFSTGSRFCTTISAALDEYGGCPESVRVVQVSLGPGGYEGDIRLEVLPEDGDHFIAEWEGRDVTRFPARIRAVATVLRDRRCFGRFHVSHLNGVVLIARER